MSQSFHDSESTKGLISRMSDSFDSTCNGSFPNISLRSELLESSRTILTPKVIFSGQFNVKRHIYLLFDLTKGSHQHSLLADGKNK